MARAYHPFMLSSSHPWRWIPRGDARIITLVGMVHGTSHFFHLLLPPSFPWFMREFGLGYSQLGLLVSVFFLVSGVGQALSGFAVDRWGARPLLFAALACFVAASLAAALATGMPMLVSAAVLAGLGNAPIHPIDFSILNRRVSAARLGHGFAVHGISGNLGWAVSPLVITGLVAATGTLQSAYVCVAGLALLVMGGVLLASDSLNDRPDAGAAWVSAPSPVPVPVPAPDPGPGDPASAAPAASARPGLSGSAFAFLRLPAVWLCFAFLFFSTCTLSAIQGFASPALQQLHGLPIAWSALVVSGFMVCGAVGMVLGGFALGRVARPEAFIAGALLMSALLLVVASWPAVPGGVALVLASLAGLGTGAAGPSRDMLIRRAAPPGATGRVYGTVYSGLDLGFAVAAPLFGWVLDAGWPAGVFAGSALALLLAVASSAWIGQVARRAQPLPRLTPT